MRLTSLKMTSIYILGVVFCMSHVSADSMLVPKEGKPCEKICSPDPFYGCIMTTTGKGQQCYEETRCRSKIQDGKLVADPAFQPELFCACNVREGHMHRVPKNQNITTVQCPKTTTKSS